MVILPLAIVATSLVREATSLFGKIQSGEYDLAGYIQRVFDALPAWAVSWLERFNLTNLSTLRDTLSSSLMKGGQMLAPQALSIGMNTFEFMISLGIMLYLLFFLMRDGRALTETIKDAVPLRADQKSALFTRFADVVRATVKGGVLVAMAQGALGGLAFAQLSAIGAIGAHDFHPEFVVLLLALALGSPIALAFALIAIGLAAGCVCLGFGDLGLALLGFLCHTHGRVAPV
jgi:predicted PurR-regulated permease PerM